MNLERNSNIFGKNSDPVSSVIRPSQAFASSKPNFGFGEIKSVNKDQNQKSMFDFKIKPVSNSNQSKVHEINPTLDFKAKQLNESKNSKVEKVEERPKVSQDLISLGESQPQPQQNVQSQIQNTNQGGDLFEDIFGDMSHSVNIPNQGSNFPMQGNNQQSSDPQENRINNIMNQLNQKGNKQADSYDFTFKHNEPHMQNNNNLYNNNQQQVYGYPPNNQYFNQPQNYNPQPNYQPQPNFNYYPQQQNNNQYHQSEFQPNQSSMVNYDIDRSMGGYVYMNQSNLNNQGYNNISVSEIQHNTNNHLDFFDTIKDNSPLQNQMNNNRNQGNEMVDNFFN